MNVIDNPNYHNIYKYEFSPKIKELIMRDVPHRKVLCGEVEEEIKYRSHSSALKAYHAGYSKTYTRKIYTYLYNINTVVKYLTNKNNTITYRKKERLLEDIVRENYYNKLVKQGRVTQGAFTQKKLQQLPLKKLIEEYVFGVEMF